MRAVVIALFGVMLVAVASPVTAKPMERWSIYPLIEIYDWREYDNAHNFRLLRESGTRFGVETKGDMPLYEDSLVLHFKGNLYFALVDYEGFAQDSTSNALHPTKSDVFYLGDDLQADVSWQVHSGELSVGPFAGIGYEWWLRDIRDGVVTGPPVDINGQPSAEPSAIGEPVNGYEELWQTYTVLFGVRGTVEVEETAEVFFEAGGRYPIYTENNANYPGAGWSTVKPQGILSPFAEVGFNYEHLTASAYYKGLRFDPSEPTALGLLQPKSEQDIVGFTLGVTF